MRACSADPPERFRVTSVKVFSLCVGSALCRLSGRNRWFGRWRRKMMLGDPPAFGATRPNQHRAQYSACGAAGSEIKIERGVALGKIHTFPQFAQFLID